MFYYIKGNVTYKTYNFMVIDVGGVGYKIYSSMTTLEKASLNSEFLVYTYTHIREDLFDIYGFSSVEELNTFQMLISVSGVGPRGALSIVSYMPTDKFALAVIHSDIKAITAAPGIGKKIAERIVLELKDKISKELNLTGREMELAASAADTGNFDEAVNALMVLGYSALEAKGAVIAVKDSCSSVEDIIKKSLAILAS